MNTSRLLIFVVILVVAGTGIIIQQLNSISQVEQMKLNALENVRRLEIRMAEQQAVNAQRAKLQALEAAQKAEAEAQRIKQQALEEARRMEEAARREAEAVKAKINGLVAQAQSLLDSGQYQNALNLATSILSQDANNAAAQSIVAQAREKLKGVNPQEGVLTGSAAVPAQ